MKPWTQHRPLASVRALAVLAIAAFVPGLSHASSLCAGDFLTSQVHPWPAGVTFNAPQRDSSPTTRARSQAFRAGLQAAGLVLDPQGRATLNVVFSIRPGTRTAATPAPESGVYGDMNWRRSTAVGATLNDPSLPGYGLNVTVIISDNRAYEQIWIGSLECTIATADTEALARDIGTNLGKVLAASMRQR